jgi:hypothetical protein
MPSLKNKKTICLTGGLLKYWSENENSWHFVASVVAQLPYRGSVKAKASAAGRLANRSKATVVAHVPTASIH